MHRGKPTEGICSLLKRSIANFAAADLDGLVRIIKREMKKIQYRHHLINGCLAGHQPENRTLVSTQYEFSLVISPHWPGIAPAFALLLSVASTWCNRVWGLEPVKRSPRLHSLHDRDG